METLCFCDDHDISGTDWYGKKNVAHCATLYSRDVDLPWVRDRVLDCAFANKVIPTIPWSAPYEEFNIQELAASFYLLDVIIYDLATEFPKELRRRHNVDPFITAGLYSEGARHRTSDDLLELSLAAQLYKHTIVEVGAGIVEAYMHRAVVGELCHHEFLRQSFYPRLEYALYGWNKLIEQAGAAKAAEYAVELFKAEREDGYSAWSSSFGGRAWAAIAQVLQYHEQGYITDPERGHTDKEWWEAGWRRPEFSAYEFLDRVFTLQHNTGTCLDKVGWCGGLNSMHKILQAHHDSMLATLVSYADDETKELFKRYWYAKNKESGLDIQMKVQRYCGNCGDEIRGNSRWCNDCSGFVCNIADCDELRYTNGYCSMHWNAIEKVQDKALVWQKGEAVPENGADYCFYKDCDCTQLKAKEQWDGVNEKYIYQFQAVNEMMIQLEAKIKKEIQFNDFKW
jgi:hypothetical protein